MEDYGVTGVRVDIDVVVDMPPERLWDLITAVHRVSEWSPECEHTALLDDGEGPVTTGTRFEGRNRREERVWTVNCVVTEVERPRSFAWIVLDAAGDPERPSSFWRYDLEPGDLPGRTRVRHSFVHGPGDSGLRERIRTHPELAQLILDVRTGELRKHMIETLNAMTAAYV
ncbi:SRPBCC family protein [Microbispora sp. H11081]|uniref:SRPBCC family protein n=1 Tax=Microbispora sp. H11081 TaxID=2729107 RepID=UPI001474B7A5|nr:SRPBCC family protein [Microbispora sp. H11081]